EGGTAGDIAERQVHGLLALHHVIVLDGYRERLGRLAGVEYQRAGGTGVVAAGVGGAVSGGVMNGDLAVLALYAADGDRGTPLVLDDAERRGRELQSSGPIDVEDLQRGVG